MLNSNDHIKIYEFDYGNKGKEIISVLFELVINLFIPLISIFFVFCFNTMMIDEYNLIIIIIEVILIFVSAVYLFLSTFFSKKVLLYQNSIHVKRNSISLNGFNDNILYSSIISCNIYRGAHFRGRGGPDYAIILFNWDNLVEIVCEKNKKYYIPVKDADDFIAEVNARVEKIKFFRALNIDSLLKDKNGKTISYYDLKVRWKSSDKIDSVYYIDDCGNNIDIIKYD